MPYQNEHSASVIDTKKFKIFKRVNNKFGTGIDAIFGRENVKSKMELKSIRFNEKKFTVAQSKEWLKQHKINVIEFAAAKNDEKDMKNDNEDAKNLLNSTSDTEEGWIEKKYYLDDLRNIIDTMLEKKEKYEK